MARSTKNPTSPTRLGANVFICAGLVAAWWSAIALLWGSH